MKKRVLTDWFGHFIFDSDTRWIFFLVFFNQMLLPPAAFQFVCFFFFFGKPDIPVSEANSPVPWLGCFVLSLFNKNCRLNREWGAQCRLCPRKKNTAMKRTKSVWWSCCFWKVFSSSWRLVKTGGTLIDVQQKPGNPSEGPGMENLLALESLARE